MYLLVFLASVYVVKTPLFCFFVLFFLGLFYTLLLASVFNLS